MFSQVPDYLEFVSEPMDFSTMHDKLEAHKYSSVADLESDFNLMISNCLRYNSNDTVFHKAAMQLWEVGGAILRHAQLQALSIGLDPSTGMHLPEKASTHNATVSWWDEGEHSCVLLPKPKVPKIVYSLLLTWLKNVNSVIICLPSCNFKASERIKNTINVAHDEWIKIIKFFFLTNDLQLTCSWTLKIVCTCVLRTSWKPCWTNWIWWRRCAPAEVAQNACACCAEKLTASVTKSATRTATHDCWMGKLKGKRWIT